MPALEKVGDYLDESRRLLQDEVTPYRYPDEDLVEALNIALLEVRRLRPDLLLPRFEIPYLPSSGSQWRDTVVSFEPMYRVALVYYVVGRAQLRDDEQTQDARAASLLTKFIGQMLTIAS